MSAYHSSKTDQAHSGLAGQFLIAMPGMSDERFAHAVVLMSNHDEEGAMGFIINQPQDIQMADLLVQLEMIDDERAANLPLSVNQVGVRYGGPVDRSRGFVVHSTDYTLHSTQRLTNDISVTSSVDILNGISHGAGPDQAIMALGYAGWGKGQLENELASNAWLNLPSHANHIFNPNSGRIYSDVLSDAGIDPTRLAAYSGVA